MEKLINSTKKEKSLKTEVVILQSPSVLMPIFNFVKNEYKNKGQKVDNLIFKEWRDNKIKVNIIRGTTVLDISYEDKRKDLVIPVLDKVSNAYKMYSKSEREQNIKNGIKYYKNQLAIYKLKSSESIKTAQKYAFEKDIALLEEAGATEIVEFNTLVPESIRIKKANELRITMKKLNY